MYGMTYLRPTLFLPGVRRVFQMRKCPTFTVRGLYKTENQTAHLQSSGIKRRHDNGADWDSYKTPPADAGGYFYFGGGYPTSRGWL